MENYDDFQHSEDDDYERYDDYYNIIENNPKAKKKDLIQEMIRNAKLHKEERQKVKTSNLNKYNNLYMLFLCYFLILFMLNTLFINLFSKYGNDQGC